MKTKKIILVLSLMIFSGGFLFAQDYAYVGVTKCKMCHNKPTTGAQYKKWLEGPHAKAFEVLKSEKALAYAKKNGIADPSKEAKCLKCHTTAATVPANLNAGVKITEGVSCESCHGAGKGYMIMTVMKDRNKSIAKGLVIPTEETCKKCHNKENPFYKEFNFAEYSKKIAHPNPAKK
ncbi:MAG: cytochrome C554 [Chlorobi bacterium]|nr:cytochrome C554 [Chlorobiota bacterium]